MRKIFIGSSSENIRYAEAIQENINNSRIHNLQAICWNQGVFNIGHSALEDLLMQLDNSDFGVFVFAKDDYVNLRDQNVYCVRDNVIFEMGLFLGKLGRERVFCLIPSDNKYHIPTDLQGIFFAKYDENNQNISVAVGTACTQIKEAIRKKGKTATEEIYIKNAGIFPKFDGYYRNYFNNSHHIVTYFIHSRKWRETNLNEIDDYLSKDGVTWDVILPDIYNETLVKSLEEHFDDGKRLIDFILDSYNFFYNYYKRYPQKLSIYSYSLYPAYSFYMFDNVIIVSMYPLTSKRHPTPTFLLPVNEQNNNFFQVDVSCILKDSKILTEDDLTKIINFKR